MWNLKEVFEKHGNLAFGIILVLIFLVAGFLWALAEPAPRTLVQLCGDGTPYDECSLDKPYFCSQETLIERSDICGCSESENFNFILENDSCISKYHTNPKILNLDYVLEGKESSLNFSVYEGINDYVSRLNRGISFSQGDVSRLDFKIKALNDSLQRETILPLVKDIQNLAPKSKVDQARIAISLVQNIPYGYSNESFSFFGESLNYSRYPYEVLYEKEGICGEKSQLLALVLKDLGYKTAIFYFQEENHEAVGIGCPQKESFNNSGYCFVETSGPAIISDFGMEYIGGINLNSQPEILIISEGISLPKSLEEYRDAKDLQDIRERNFLGFLKQFKRSYLYDKYNLAEIYNLD